jgi:hypothetical protein
MPAKDDDQLREKQAILAKFLDVHHAELLDIFNTLQEEGLDEDEDDEEAGDA